MLERLLEHWLDSVNERSYQVPFWQLLAAQGYTVLHSTRHMPLEFGKDVIAIGPDGVPCAFQLKGDPGTRLTLNQYRQIEAQLNELVTHALVYPGIPTRPHRSYLVTNGLIEEEVHRAIDDFNRRLDGLGLPDDQRLQLISRGQILDCLIRFGSSIWPIEISPMKALLQLLAFDGSEMFPITNLDSILRNILGLEDQGTIRTAEMLRQRIFAAAIMTAFALSSFEKEKNHYAAICAWILFISYTHGACDRYNYSFRNGAPAVAIGRSAIFDALAQLWDEICERVEKSGEHFPEEDQHSLYRIALVEGDGFANSIIGPGRIALVTGLMSLFWFWCEDEGWPKKKAQTALRKCNTVASGGIGNLG